MVSGIEGFIERTQRARTIAQLRQAFVEAMLNEGYENVVYDCTRNKQLEYIACD
jgi:hypothetical protein